MIKVEFEPSQLSGEKREWWEAWEARAERAKRAAKETVERGELPDLERFQSVWADLKKWLFKNLFYGKCAYCEGKLTPQSYGEGEHWRPKRGVQEKREGKLRTVEREGTAHPGYWWLAYEWSNLLPACQLCNNIPAKGMQFPVGKTHVFDPTESGLDELDDREQPLLLHPLRGEDPEEHLGFDEFGQVFPRRESRLGSISIEVFDLKREELAEHRREFIDRGATNFGKAMFFAAQEQRPLKEVIREMFDDAADYSAALRAQAQHFFDEFAQSNIENTDGGDGPEDPPPPA